MKIRARDRWNETGVMLVRGHRYRLKATGRWTDFFITCDANGFTSDRAPRLTRGKLKEYEHRRRAPHENWFTLLGAYGRDDSTLFRIGVERILDAERDGQLVCFANDVWKAYWNNWGEVELEVTEL